MRGTRGLPSRLFNVIQRRVKKGSIAGLSVEFNQDIVDYWQPLADSLAETLRSSDAPTALLIDELPFFIENMIDKQSGALPVVRQILATLRSWRFERIPMVLAGSISLDFLLDDLGISGLVMNDVARMELGPLDAGQGEPQGLLEALVDHKGLRSWTEATYGDVLARIDDPYPFFIQRAFAKLCVEDRGDPDYVAHIFERDVWPDLRHSFFKQFDERLRKRLAADQQKAAKAILNHLARSRTGTIGYDEIAERIDTEAVDLDDLLWRLEGQDYLRFDPAGRHYRLALNMLKVWRQTRGG